MWNFKAEELSNYAVGGYDEIQVLEKLRLDR